MLTTNKRLVKLLQNKDLNVDEIIREIAVSTPIDIAVLSLKYQEEDRYDFAYWCAIASEDVMMTVAYLWSVLGNPPYIQATKFGLNEQDIVEFQALWRSRGIEPIEHDYFGEDPEKTERIENSQHPDLKVENLFPRNDIE